MQRHKVTVYPRSRGEHINAFAQIAVSGGLSPLSRGTQQGDIYEAKNWRFIPALAGNTPQPSFSTSRSSVYPRSRGEHSVCYPPGFQRIGLSPLSRGTHYPFLIKNDLGRFIPALAGNTNAAAQLLEYAAVYPRSRGEHLYNVAIASVKDGLSPLSRGTRVSIVCN
ncbi:Domain of uncharacterised function (DUF2825) [Salmonella enterica subsp. salamae]|uniref:Domain of uncharacterized function (DUF2825) n=1 Tax=Salmonella enterica subsp. salamae TaxID=59202 RepID=A0A6D2G933_SALER|nr:Domain of uncharacterised function (DUF2825) [Salmonella enterica subsp. salamae]